VHISTIFALLSTAIVSNLILALRLANASLSVRQLEVRAAYHFSECHNKTTNLFRSRPTLFLQNRSIKFSLRLSIDLGGCCAVPRRAKPLARIGS